MPRNRCSAHLLSTGPLWGAIRTRGGRMAPSASVSEPRPGSSPLRRIGPEYRGDAAGVSRRSPAVAGGMRREARHSRRGSSGCVARDARPWRRATRADAALSGSLDQRRPAPGATRRACSASLPPEYATAAARCSRSRQREDRGHVSREAVEAAAREDAALSVSRADDQHCGCSAAGTVAVIRAASMAGRCGDYGRIAGRWRARARPAGSRSRPPFRGFSK